MKKLQPKTKLLEECRCPCHTFGGELILHCVPCCSACPDCGRHIATNQMEEHQKSCHQPPAAAGS